MYEVRDDEGEEGEKSDAPALLLCNKRSIPIATLLALVCSVVIGKNVKPFHGGGRSRWWTMTASAN